MNANSDIVKNFYEEIINRKNLSSIGDFLTVDFIHNGVSRGLEGQRKIIEENFLDAFPDLNVTCEFFVCEDEMVTVHNKWNGTHSGNFLGVAPTGKSVMWESNAILKISSGKICQAWDENDFLSLFMQIGSFPQIPAAK